jgi:hypothetical protein
MEEQRFIGVAAVVHHTTQKQQVIARFDAGIR